MHVVVATEPGQRDLLDEIESIYRTKLPEFRRVARAVLGDPERARDAVQDGFVRAVRDRAAFRGDASLDGWVWGCVMNAIRDAGRTLGKQRRLRDVSLPELASEHQRQDEVIRGA